MQPSNAIMRLILHLRNQRSFRRPGVLARFLHICTLLVTVSLLAPLPLAAQETAAVTVEVAAGFDGAGQYRSSHWFPALVTVANDGPDLRGEVVWRFPGDGPVFRYDLDLPRGARKQIPLAITSTESPRSATVSVIANGAEQARSVVRLSPVPVEQMLIGVISSDANLLNTLSLITTPNNANAVVTRLAPSQITGDAMLLTGLDVIMLHDLATDQLEPAQVNALDLWTRLGGQLVVGGGIHAEATTGALNEWLPVDVGPLRSDTSSASLGRLARRSDLAESVPTLTTNAVTLRPGARNLDGADLLTSSDHGAGQVIFAAFDLAALRPWAGEASLWERVVRPDARMLMGQSFRWRSENLLRDTLQLPALRLPSIGILSLLVLGYIVAIGPLNFLILRRMRRLELAWITTPVLVALFLALTYGASFLIRGNTPQLTQLAIVQGFEDSPQAQSTTFIGLFSPQRRTYTLQTTPETLITPGGFEGFQFRLLDVTASDTATRVDDLLVDVSSLRTLITEHPAEALPIESTISEAGDVWQVDVRNAGSIPLEDVLIVRGTAAQPIGALAPGAAGTATIDRNQFNFPEATWSESAGLINRFQVVNNLFSYDRFSFGGPQFAGSRGIPEPDAFYLLGWATLPALNIDIGAPGSTTQGEILYIIRLDDQ